MKWKQIILAFLLGTAFAAGTYWWKWTFHRYMGGQDRYHWKLKRFSSRLDLNEDQKAKIGSILEAKRQKIKTVREEVEPKYEAIRNSTREEIRSVLRPEQIEKFEKLDAEMAQKRLMRKKWKEKRK